MGLSNIKSSSSALVVAASDSLHPERADYVCDGTDDQVQIQAALDLGSTILMEGNYAFSGPVVTSSANTYLYGRGAVLTLDAGINGMLINVQHDNTCINELTLDGNGGNQTSGNGLIEVTENSNSLTLDNVHFKNAWNNGLYGLGTPGNNRLENLRMSYCVAEDCYNGIDQQSGMVYLNYAKNVQIDHCIMDNFTHNANHADGIKVIHANNIQISHLLINNISGHGIFVGYGSEDVTISDIIFTADFGHTLESVCIEFAADGSTGGVGRNKRVAINNVTHCISGGGNNGLYLETCDDLTVSNCSVEITDVAMGNPHYAIRYIDNGKFTNCTSRGLLSNDSTGFRVDHSKDVSLIGCSVVDSPVWAWTAVPRGGVDVISSENTLFSGCNFRDLPTNGMTLLDSDIIIDRCTFVNMGIGGSWRCWCILVEPGHDDIVMTNNTFELGSGGLTKGIALESGCDNCIITNNKYGVLVTNVSIHATCTGIVLRDNIGYVTENSGTATLANGSTSIAVTHGLAITPAAGDITVTPMEAWGNMTQFYIDTYTATQFTIRADINPGQDVDFAWKAVAL